MSWQVIVAVSAAVVAPWVGIIVLVLVQAKMADRLGVLQHKVTVLEETVRILTADLGWKKE